MLKVIVSTYIDIFATQSSFPWLIVPELCLRYSHTASVPHYVPHQAFHEHDLDTCHTKQEV